MSTDARRWGTARRIGEIWLRIGVACLVWYVMLVGSLVALGPNAEQLWAFLGVLAVGVWLTRKAIPEELRSG